MADDAGLSVSPYAATAGVANDASSQPIAVQADDITVLSARLADLSPGLSGHTANHMFLWVESEGGCGEQHLRWTVAAPVAGRYAVRVLFQGEQASVTAACEESSLGCRLRSKGWDRFGLGELDLSAGVNLLDVTVMSGAPFRLSTVELVRPDVEAALSAEAAESRRRPKWFSDAGYGLMFQWTNRATPRRGPVKPWPQKVADFDVEAFADRVGAMGAAYVIWSMTWGQQFISAPLRSLDSILPGRTTERDLLAEIADALAARGVKLIFYYHYGYDCYHSTDTDWMQATGCYRADKSRFFACVGSVVSELGQRLGDRLHGWFFDGGQRYYNCHFDGSEPIGPLSAPWRELASAARAGNPDRIISYNSWVMPRLTEFQDYFCGEGRREFADIADGVFTDGPQQGLQAHGCFPLERRWGHIDPDLDIGPPRYALQELTRLVRMALDRSYPISINLEMYEDGTVSPDSEQLLCELRTVCGRDIPTREGQPS